MLNRVHVTVLLALAVLVWAISLRVSGIALTWDYSKPFTVTVTVLTTASVLFDKCFWKLPIFKGW